MGSALETFVRRASLVVWLRRLLGREYFIPRWIGRGWLGCGGCLLPGEHVAAWPDQRGGLRIPCCSRPPNHVGDEDDQGQDDGEDDAGHTGDTGAGQLELESVRGRT